MVNPAAGAHAVPALQRIVEELAGEFAGTFSRETVESCVLDSELQLTATARVMSFIPISGRAIRPRAASGCRAG